LQSVQDDNDGKISSFIDLILQEEGILLEEDSNFIGYPLVCERMMSEVVDNTHTPPAFG
jgi:hypothetical protein